MAGGVSPVGKPGKTTQPVEVPSSQDGRDALGGITAGPQASFPEAGASEAANNISPLFDVALGEASLSPQRVTEGSLENSEIGDHGAGGPARELTIEVQGEKNRALDFLGKRFALLESKSPAEQAKILEESSPMLEAFRDASAAVKTIEMQEGLSKGIITIQSVAGKLRVSIGLLLSLETRATKPMLLEMTDRVLAAVAEHARTTQGPVAIELVAGKVVNSKLERLMKDFGFERRHDLDDSLARRAIRAAVAFGVGIACFCSFSGPIFGELVPLVAVFLGANMLRSAPSYSFSFSVKAQPKGTKELTLAKL